MQYLERIIQEVANKTASTEPQTVPIVRKGKTRRNACYLTSFLKGDLTPVFSSEAAHILSTPFYSLPSKEKSISAKAPSHRAQNKEQHENTSAVALNQKATPNEIIAVLSKRSCRKRTQKSGQGKTPALEEPVCCSLIFQDCSPSLIVDLFGSRDSDLFAAG